MSKTAAKAKSGDDGNWLSPAERNRLIPIKRNRRNPDGESAEEILHLHEDTIKRHFGEHVIRTSERGSRMQRGTVDDIVHGRIKRSDQADLT